MFIVLFLATTIASWLGLPSMRHATVAVDIRDVATGEVVVSHDAERAVQPASTMKLLTTGAALGVLGADYAPVTEVWTSGAVDAAGTLHGDLVVRGGGDAMLASAWGDRPQDHFVRAVVDAVRRAGIRRIDGAVVGDGTLVGGNPLPTDWTWEDIGNHYAPPVSGLCYGDNRTTLTFDTSVRRRQPRLLSVRPEVPGLVVDNRLSADDWPFDSAYVYGSPFDGRRVVYGAIPQRGPTFSIRADVPDPALLAAAEVRRALVAAGVECGDAVSRAATATTKLLDYRGAPLSYVVRQTNHHSLNLHAEMLWRLMSAAGTTPADYWRSRGVDVGGLRQYDGCGLAPTDRLTARLLTSLLCVMQADTTFVASLPVAGREGTVRNFLRGTRLDGHACLKTGTTKGVVAYAGYVDGTDGRRYAVAVIVNSYDGPAAAVRRAVADLLLSLVP